MAAKPSIQNDRIQSLFRLADEVSRFWYGAHLNLEIIEEDEGPSMDWYTVSFPVKMLADPDYARRSILFHEWGHRTISPESPEIAKLWKLVVLETLKALVKLDADEEVNPQLPPDLVNMVTDLWVDRFYLECPKTAEDYMRSTARSIAAAQAKLTPSRPREDEPAKKQAGVAEGASETTLFQLFLDLYRIMMTDVSTGKKEFASTLHEEAYVAVFQGTLEPEERLRAFTRAVIPLLPKGPAEVYYVPVNGANPMPDDSHEEDPNLNGTRLIRLMKKCGLKPSLGDLQECLGEGTGTGIFASVRAMELYSRVITSVDKHLSSNPGDRRFAGYTRWKVGDPVRDLEIVPAMERFGRIMPNTNTLKKSYMRGRGMRTPRGRANICLVVDDSGSITWDHTLDRMQEALFALILAAERRNDRAAMLLFGSEITFFRPPQREYTALKRRVALLNGDSGGTEIGPALDMALQTAREFQGQDTFIFTDSYVFEDDEEVVRKARELSKISHTVLFIFSEDRAQADHFTGLFPHRDIHAYFVPRETGFVESSLQELTP